MEGIQEVERNEEDIRSNEECNEGICVLNQNPMGDRQHDLQLNGEEPNEGICVLNQSLMEGKQHDLQPNGEEPNEGICVLNQSLMEGKQHDLQPNGEEPNEEICVLSQSPMADRQHDLQPNGEEPNERNCAVNQSSTNGRQEEEGKEKELGANEEKSNVIVEVVPNSSVITDAPREPFDDNITDYVRRNPVSSDSESDAESISSSVSISSLSSLSSLEDIRDPNKKKKNSLVKSTKTKGELGIEDLPPVEALTISVPEDDMQEIGTVYCVVDQLVVVESFLNSPALDFDSVLFLSHGKPLGNIFEVFGPVKQPYYVVRFNTNDEIVKSGIANGDSVFYAPSHSNITSFIFTDKLMRQKGSDASWEHNNEPPEEHLDFSDDEQERTARRRRAAKNRRPSICDRYSIRRFDNPKRQNIETETESDVVPDVPRITLSTRNNYFHNYKKTGGLASYSSRSILKPPSNVGFATYHQRVNYNCAKFGVYRDVVPDVPRITPSTTNNYFHNYKKTGGLASYSSRNILKPPSNVGFPTDHNW